jgi:hypothetical protein
MKNGHLGGEPPGGCPGEVVVDSASELGIDRLPSEHSLLVFQTLRRRLGGKSQERDPLLGKGRCHGERCCTGLRHKARSYVLG